MTEQCTFCGNKNLTAKTTRYYHQHREDMLIIEHVPCIPCDFCGEQYFDVSVLKKIEIDHSDIVEHRRKPSRFIRIPVDDFEPRVPLTA